jgi:excisionase family DNA binding protein
MTEPEAVTGEWLTVKDAAARAKCSPKLIYQAVKAGRLRASRLGVRLDIRIYSLWLEAWLVGLSTPVPINPSAPGTEPENPGALPFHRHGRRAKDPA